LKRMLSALFHSPTCLVFRLSLNLDILWPVGMILIHGSANSEIFVSR
jgi:hypothetical protein